MVKKLHKRALKAKKPAPRRVVRKKAAPRPKGWGAWLNIAFVVFALLAGSVFAARSQSDPSSSLSHLSPGTSISGSDLFYDVQVPGVGGVKVTGTQFLSFVFGNVTGNCSSSGTGVFSCTGGNATGIAAGTNIATSGTGTNVTINTTLTPTFTTITTTRESNTGWLTASGVNMQTATIAGALIGSTANFSGALVGTTGNFSGNLTAPTAQFPGFLTASGSAFQTATIAGNLTSGSGSFTTSLTAGNVQVSGFLTASGANFTSATIFGISGSTQCVQANSIGLLSGTSSPCSAPTVSIAAGNNISTNGTATNITIQVIPNPTFTSLTSTIAAIPSYLTVGGVNVFTASIAGNLTGTTAQFTGALTGTTAVFQTITDNGIGAGTQCVQSIAGVFSGTGAGCSGALTVKGGPLLPSSEYLGGGSGLIFPNFYIPNTNTSGAGALEGVGYIATTTIATATLQFNMPETIPTGNARLRILQMANATTGSVQYTVSDAVTSPSNSLGTVTMNFEGVTSVAQTVADQLIEKKILLTVTPTANQILSVLIGTTSSVAQTITYQPSIVWE